ncbi:MAG: rhodanese-like domain-containing protein [Methylococcales bacterium]|nr:rhodanese-like domain-containing protein [Methylococcales bacterium]
MDQYIEFISNHYLLCLGFVVVTFLLLQDLIESSFYKFKALSPMLVVAKMNSADTIVVDVRDLHEYIQGHIEDSRNLPLSKFSERIESLEEFKNQAIIVVCQTGTRSISACKTLTKANFNNVFNMVGGMQSWEDNKLPVHSTSKDKK